MVGLVENALMEIKEKMNPDRIIIESRWAIITILVISCRRHGALVAKISVAQLFLLL